MSKTEVGALPTVEIPASQLQRARSMCCSMALMHAYSKLRDYAQTVKNRGETCCILFFRILPRLNTLRQKTVPLDTYHSEYALNFLQ